MHLADFHIHSNCSSDAQDTMLDMALATGELGVEQMCFTDHCDIDHFITGIFDPNCFDVWESIRLAYEELLREAPAKLDIKLGLELGEGNHRPELATTIASQPELDFILGSVHNLLDTPDFYALQYTSMEQCVLLLERYLDELYELAALDSFDVISHIGYTRRYMLRAGFDLAVEHPRFSDKVDALLRRIIERGKGIEINCSGLRHPAMECPIPDVPILKRYRELGGEIITTGSDAHRVSDAGRGIGQSVEILKSLGYKYYTTFDKRKPEFIKII